MIIYKYTLTDENKLLKQKVTTEMFHQHVKNGKVWIILLFDEKGNELSESGFRYDYFMNEVLNQPFVTSRRICYFSVENDKVVFEFYKDKLRTQMARAMRIFTKTVGAYTNFDWYKQ